MHEKFRPQENEDVSLKNEDNSIFIGHKYDEMLKKNMDQMKKSLNNKIE